MKNNIAIVILNNIQFINVKPVIEILTNKGYPIDIYCPDTNDETGFKELFLDNVNNLKRLGYKIYRKVQKTKKYKVLLEPYPCVDIDSKYKIRYHYSTISAKPNIVYAHPENYIKYDAILCGGKYDANYLSIYSKTFVTGNTKFINFKKKRIKSDKKVLLYLPTYGDCCSIDLVGNYLSSLKDEYYIIAKIHHGTSFLKDESSRIETVKNNVDEFYDLHKNLSELLSVADVVLSDNSGSIFEALYTYTPVAVFSNDINQNKWGGFNTTQYELYQLGILPYTNKLEKISDILKQAQSDKIKKMQKKWSNENLYHPENQVFDFVNIIEDHINDKVDKRYYDFHNEFRIHYFNLFNENISNNNKIKNLNFQIENNNKEIEEYKNNICDCKTEINNYKTKIDNYQKQINDYETEINNYQKQINYYETGKLYMLAKFLYKIKNGGK